MSSGSAHAASGWMPSPVEGLVVVLSRAALWNRGGGREGHSGDSCTFQSGVVLVVEDQIRGVVLIIWDVHTVAPLQAPSLHGAVVRILNRKKASGRGQGVLLEVDEARSSSKFLWPSFPVEA
jgi:hypothetical protein